MTYGKFCRDFYQRAFDEAFRRLGGEAAAQKRAIQETIMAAISRFPDEEAADLWEAIYAAHVHRKSGIDDRRIIENVIGADQSWKKSSGHAFEEFIKEHGTDALRGNNIEIVLQRDLTAMIKNGGLDNFPKDIEWLKTQIDGDVFDLYSIVKTADGKRFCYGCIQSKTSIRDRVSRDREPSMRAMDNFFWSVIVALDGGFLAMPKFNAMVNGGSGEFPENGWHGMYVFSEKYTHGRIYPTDPTFRNFREHAVRAATYWLTQRQWFTRDWKATDAE